MTFSTKLATDPRSAMFNRLIKLEVHNHLWVLFAWFGPALIK